MHHPPPPIVTREADAPPRPSSGWLGIPIAIVLLAGAWIALASAGRGPLLLPPPGAVLASLERLLGDPAFMPAVAATLSAAGAGFLIALVAGAVASAVFSGPLRLGTLVLLGVPGVALMPLAVLWLSPGMQVGIVGAAVLAFGPMAVGFAADGAARRPAATVGAAMALNGALVAELLAGREGLGHIVRLSLAQFDIVRAGAATVVLVAIGVVAVLLVHALAAVFVRDDRARSGHAAI